MTRVAEIVEVGLGEHGCDGGGGNERTPARGIEVSGDAVVGHHAPRTDVEAEVGVLERTGLNTTVPQGGSRSVTPEWGDLEFIIGVGRESVRPRDTVASKPMHGVKKRRRGKTMVCWRSVRQCVDIREIEITDVEIESPSILQSQ